MDPFGDSVSHDVQILDVPLGKLQEKMLKCGLRAGAAKE